MVTQLLFGETVKIYEERKKDWRRARTAYDDYECWIDQKQITFISQEEFDRINLATVSGELVHVVENKENGLITPVTLGSSLPEFKKGNIRVGEQPFHFSGHTIDTSKPIAKEQLVQHAMMYLNSPYLWGGRSPFGIDCSGFTQVVYKLNGVKLPRDASQQAEIGQTLSFIEESESGDLAFFDNEDGNIIHVGIMLENNCIIHASGKVRIDKIDHQGIFNVDTGDYSHRLRLIKKIL
ncbi:MAG: C40 family peptidase [Flavobacteriales bacterium]|nr:C40 family peptidase [Flavobacteriales bacterium]